MVMGFIVGISISALSVGFGIVFLCTRSVVSSRGKAKRSDQGIMIDSESEKYLEAID